jgi:hypothetical protein
MTQESRAPDTAPSPVATSRRTVRLTALAEVDTTPAPRLMPERGARHRASRGLALPTSRDDWLVLAERVVGDWAATLHAALFLALALAAAIMVIGLVFGLGAALATAFVALIVLLAGRRRDGLRRR